MLKRAPNTTQKVFLWLLFISGWGAIIAQFCLLLYNRKLGVFPTIIQFFSYFTILTNILVALHCSFVLLSPHSRRGRWFSQPAVATAITVYIFIVGAVYNVVLRLLWSPAGLQKIVDEALHSLIPVLFLFYWLLFVPKEKLKWKNVFPWLIYPLLYLLYVLARGAITGLYPYPFIDVTVIGYSKAILNSIVLLFIFSLVCILFVGIGKYQYRNHPVIGHNIS